MATDPRLVLFGCGDVGPIHEPMDAYSTLVRPLMETADLRIGQCERVYSERGSLQVHSTDLHSRVSPRLASVFTDCAFDVVSVASNHAVDWGADALMDTIDLLQSKGIQTVGAGRDLDEARRPAVVERNGVTVAILAYCSVLREGYAAGTHKPGVAPLRARTFYEPREYQAGVPPRVLTIPYEEDVAGMVEDITAARQRADAVVLVLHWGLHFIPRTIADYQTAIAQAAFAAGADLILGHHAHVPKAVAVYGGKVCYYSLSNFIMSANEASPVRAKRMMEDYGVDLDPQYPRLPYGADAKRSLIARADISPNGIERVSFRPVLIDTQLRPEPLRGQDPRFEEAVRYMDWASEGYNHRFTVEGDDGVGTSSCGPGEPG
jgi:poly-gamma-glutamate capsule biosynthesis protein CapA/YwtB (metallophosphatase superfamily)